MKTATFTRKTKETDIILSLEVRKQGEGGNFSGSSGIGFLDHMLAAVCLHGNLNLTLEMTGDLAVDCHHSVEDLGIVFGEAFKEACADSVLCRYGSSYVPMDESLARAVIDLSGRPYLVFKAAFDHKSIGALDTEMIREFFYAFAMHAGATIHLELLYGGNDHHKAEALFKAFARALSQAAQEKQGELLSTKGVL